MSPTKHCSYCGRYQPKETFHNLLRNRITVSQCDACFQARKNPKANQARLESLIAIRKEENKRDYVPFMKEKVR